MRRQPGWSLAVLSLLTKGVVALSFRMDEQIPAIQALMNRYANVPMSLADSRLVRMAEQIEESQVLTIDHDFTIYRRQGRQPIAAILPGADCILADDDPAGVVGVGLFDPDRTVEEGADGVGVGAQVLGDFGDGVDAAAFGQGQGQ